MRKIFFIKLSLLVLCLMWSVAFAQAQTTEFTYQGKLSDTGAPSANYDFEFRLFATDTGGSAISTIQRLNVPVSNGVFAVKLDFGNQFPGAARYLEIAVRNAGGASYTTLTPRQLLASVPYSVRSLSAATANTALTANLLGEYAPGNFI